MASRASKQAPASIYDICARREWAGEETGALSVGAACHPQGAPVARAFEQVFKRRTATEAPAAGQVFAFDGDATIVAMLPRRLSRSRSHVNDCIRIHSYATAHTQTHGEHILPTHLLNIQEQSMGGADGLLAPRR